MRANLRLLFGFFMGYHIKLSKVNSTNDFLKKLSRESPLPNGAMVSADFQEKGRGQLENNWCAAKGKNILCSVFYRFENIPITHLNYLNYAVALGVYNTLNHYNIPLLKIKWPNDIVANGKKIAGILIENNIENDRLKESIVGVGININQKKFPNGLHNAVSLCNILEATIPLEKILTSLSQELEKSILAYKKAHFKVLSKNYHQQLFLRNVPSFFEGKEGVFKGTIQGVNTQGALMILHETGEIKNYPTKNIRFCLA